MAVERSRSGYAVGVLAAVLVAAIGYMLWSAYDHQAVAAWLQRLRPLPFFIAAAVLPALGLPTTPFAVLAGAVFGIPLGFAISWSALVLNAVLSFLIARRLRPMFNRLLRNTKRQLPDFSEREGGLRFVLGVKVVPGVPAFLKNYMLGMSGVPFRMFLVVASVFTGLYTLAFVVLGESLLDHRPSRTVIALAVLAALIAVAVWFRRRNKLRER